MKQNSAVIMKKVYVYIFGLAIMGLVMTSCQKEEYTGESILASFESNGRKTHLTGVDNLENRWDNNVALDPEQIMVVYPTQNRADGWNLGTTGTSFTNWNYKDNSHGAVKYTAIDVLSNQTQALFEPNQDVSFTNADNIERLEGVNGGVIELYYPASCYESCTTRVGQRARRSNNTHNYSTIREYQYEVTNRKVKLDFFQYKDFTYSHDTRDWPMYGTVTQTTSGNCRIANFYNLCGGLRLRLSSTDSAAYITKITVYTDNKALAGEFTLTDCPSTLDANGTGHLCAATYDAVGNAYDNERKLVYEPGERIVNITSGSKDFDICLPVGTYGARHLWIRIEGLDGKYCIKELQSDLTIRRDELKVINFTDLRFERPQGAVFAYYSVSPTKMVYFAQGNLWYNDQSHVWRLAENQWDVLTPDGRLTAAYDANGELIEYDRGGGSNNSNIHLTTYNNLHTYYDQNSSHDWELFGWSSGSNDNYGAITNYGSNSNSTYNGGFVDWGTLPIQNGGNVPYQWRTLFGGDYEWGVENGYDNYGEWDYLMTRRIVDRKIIYELPDAYRNNSNLNKMNQNFASWAIVRVETSTVPITGLLLFPDRFNWEETGMSVLRIPRYMNANPPSWTDTNIIVYTHAEIVKLAGNQSTSCGCTFMPAAGSRGGRSVEQVSRMIRYWLNSEPDKIAASGSGGTWTGAYYIGFMPSDNEYPTLVVPADSAHDLYWGRCVRLAMDAQPYDTRLENTDPVYPDEDYHQKAHLRKQGYISNRSSAIVRRKNN